MARAQRKVKRKARKNRSRRPRPEALLHAQYVLVLSTFPPAAFSAAQVLEAYRCRWQVELVFKRFKQLLRLGHLPKTHPDSAPAWLYGKLFLALLTEKLIAQARAFSPWGANGDYKQHALAKQVNAYGPRTLPNGGERAPNPEEGLPRTDQRGVALQPSD